LRFLHAKRRNMTAANARAPITAPTPIPAFAPVLSLFDPDGGDGGGGGVDVEVIAAMPTLEPGDAVREAKVVLGVGDDAANLMLSLEARRDA
jgi:hypothetical protein